MGSRKAFESTGRHGSREDLGKDFRNGDRWCKGPGVEQAKGPVQLGAKGEEQCGKTIG